MLTIDTVENVYSDNVLVGQSENVKSTNAVIPSNFAETEDGVMPLNVVSSATWNITVGTADIVTTCAMDDTCLQERWYVVE